jgi:hypothetical protein
MSDQERQAIGGSDSNYWNWTEHLALMIGGVSTLLIAVRLLSAADFAPETAYAILQSNGTTAVIVGTLIPLIGPAAATLTVLIGRMLIRK